MRPFIHSSPYPNTPSLNDLRWKLVNFALPDEGRTCTINVDYPGGVEVLEISPEESWKIQIERV
jgi:hypothetical protein